MTLGGLLGASLLYLILNILAKSLATSFWSFSFASYSYTNPLKVLRTPLICSSYSTTAYSAASSSSGPYRGELLPRRLTLMRVVYISASTFIWMILSGITPNYWRDSACTWVLGNPSIIHDCPSFSYCAIYLLASSMTMLSGTYLYARKAS